MALIFGHGRLAIAPPPPPLSPRAENLDRAGQTRRTVLTDRNRTKLNIAPDRDFYAFPRLVTHVDDGFIRELTDVYRQRIPAGSEVLDLMSSWVSHLPPEFSYKRVVGHGLNAQELLKNKRLDDFFVKDLNRDPSLSGIAAESFDAVVCAVSVQYLEQPEKIFAEILRVLRPGGVCIVSFSNRMFYDKAIAAWRNGSDYSRIQLVVQYFQAVAGFTQPEIIKRIPGMVDDSTLISRLLNFWRAPGKDPFYAVISYRNIKPV
ncbi:hypothetical protein SELMODRAFT_445737 [Selaginella moellendorffii]|uniref:Methyltransferase type 11 domain-containing protein n=1 Tax=Selaginella moellendorffii TaxID=88036 RepID=D8SKU9_SELML|nr:uncharacterized protein LOC9644687 [Selaginella moellendorffii]EFJ14913.1 hypothetical protein SELMODRAFT_445737 [Selaginella moellendorffii]|eukprot:XP_002983901.1 uncharacterized protein LOC9644687 [Selaginella moellendorffii]